MKSACKLPDEVLTDSEWNNFVHKGVIETIAEVETDKEDVQKRIEIIVKKGNTITTLQIDTMKPDDNGVVKTEMNVV